MPVKPTSDHLSATPTSRSFLIRFWQEGTHTPWRVWVQSVQTGDVYLFADLEAMHSFFQKQITPNQEAAATRSPAEERANRPLNP